MNTAGIMPKDAKKVIAGLPTTIDALKNHIFNDIIWPNLSDENDGVGFVTYKRLVDASVIGGNIDYKPVIEGLSVQVWPVSHGHCMKAHKHRATDVEEPPTPGISASRHQGHAYIGTGNGDLPAWRRKCVYDSSCFFIRDDVTMKELLIFGDVEPDSVSISIPRRNLPVWIYAAEKIHRGILSTIFIECSYDIHQPDPFLFGHLTPRHIIEELSVLASKVVYYREMETPRRLKRRRTTITHNNDSFLQSYNPFLPRSASPSNGYASSDEAYDSETPRSPRDMEGIRYNTGSKRRRTEDLTAITSAPTPAGAVGYLEGQPLKGLKVVIMHIKDDFDDDRDVRQSILANLRKLDAQAGLGVTFELAENGGSMFF